MVVCELSIVAEPELSFACLAGGMRSASRWGDSTVEGGGEYISDDTTITLHM